MRSRPPRFLAPLIAIAATLTGCGGLTRLAYENVDFAIRFSANEYFELNSDQQILLRPGIDEVHRWHRNTELPRYAELAAGAASKVDRGLTAADVLWAIDQIRAHYGALASEAIDRARSVLATLNPENVSAFERKLATSTDKLERAYLGDSPAHQREQRARAVRKPLEDWLGALTSDQLIAVEGYARSAPQFSQARFDERRLRHRDLIRILRANRGITELSARLKQYFVEQDAVQIKRSERAIAEFVLTIDRSLTPQQRARVVKRFERYASDFRTLATRAGRADPAMPSVNQALAETPQ